MAMLAEKRSRVKWTLNPRGKLWQNDETKFGQKLMEKMGWSKGKGLGRNQQGDLDPVRVMYKQDSKGLGFKWSNDDWIAHKEDFNAILANLNVVTDGQVTNAEPVAAVSLEQKSKTSRSRVHYHKFTRGKDMSRYSEEDLKCILGERKKKENKDEEPVIEAAKEPVEESSSDEGEETSSHGVTTIKRGSINDYFAQKMAKFTGKMTKNNSSDDDEERPSFGFGYNTSGDEESRVGFQVETDTVGLGMKPEGHGFEPEIANKEKPNIFVSLLNQFETETTRKRKRRIEEIDNETNEILEKSEKTKKEVTKKPTVRFDDDVMVKYISDTSLEVKEEPKKKKAKRESEVVELVTAEVHAEPVEADEVHLKKKKKKKKSTEEKEAEEGMEEVKADKKKKAEDIQVEEEVKADKKKKKKKEKLQAEEIVAETETIQIEAEAVKSKKKKKKSKTEDEDQINEEIVPSKNGISTCNDRFADESETVVKKSKKKKKDKNKENDEALNAEEVEVTKKEKKKKRKEVEDTEVAVENVTLLSAVGESSKKKRKREEQNCEVRTTEQVELIMAKKLEKSPQFEYVSSEIKPEKVRALQENYTKARFDYFAGSNLLEIAGYGK